MEVYKFINHKIEICEGALEEMCFEDAEICYAEAVLENGEIREATPQEIRKLNEDLDLRYSLGHDYFFNVAYFTDYEIESCGDYPDFTDTFITAATAVLKTGEQREATEAELEKLDEDGELVYELALEKYF